MAQDTPLSLRQQVIYSVYVRNHTKEGTFRALIPDLPRIRSLGADIVWLLPIHPIGIENKKGTLGCPYANRDYRDVNPEYGTLEDFRALVDAVHEQGMKLMIDVVYNHTSPDSVLLREHPEYFYLNEDGKPGNRIGPWTDVVDLDYSQPGLWDYQIESLKYWAGMVDGFRCDVASLVPLAFWKRTRAEVAAIKPDFLWLAETVHRGFNDACRRRGIATFRDTEGFEAFDMEYEYDIREIFDAYLRGNARLSYYMDQLNFQEFAYPENYNKLRFLENHDQPRIASSVGRESNVKNWTALLFFLKGTTMLYAGQEMACAHLPDLFDKDPVNWDTGRDLTELITKLAKMKKELLSVNDRFYAKADDKLDIAVLTRDGDRLRKVGVFPLRSRAGSVKVELPDGKYPDYLNPDRVVTVKDGVLHTDGTALVLTAPLSFS